VTGCFFVPYTQSRQLAIGHVCKVGKCLHFPCECILAIISLCWCLFFLLACSTWSCQWQNLLWLAVYKTRQMTDNSHPFLYSLCLHSILCMTSMKNWNSHRIFVFRLSGLLRLYNVWTATGAVLFYWILAIWQKPLLLSSSVCSGPPTPDADFVNMRNTQAAMASILCLTLILVSRLLEGSPDWESNHHHHIYVHRIEAVPAQPSHRLMKSLSGVGGPGLFFFLLEPNCLFLAYFHRSCFHDKLWICFTQTL